MNKITQFFGAAAVIIIALVFVLQFRPASQQAVTSKGPDCAAEIQGDCVPATHFTASYRLIGRGIDAEQARAMGLRRRTTEGLVERWLLNEDAKRLGISVSEEDITEELASGRAHVSLPASEGPPNNLTENLVRFLNVRNRQTKKFDKKQYERDVRVVTQLSPTEFREHQKKELVAARMRNIIRSRAHVGEAEAFALYSREKSTSTLSYVKLDARFYQDIVIDASAKAVDAWAASNKEEVDKVWESRKAQYTPECRVAREIFVRIPEEGSDEQKAEAGKAIQTALERLNKGEDFAEVAKTVSQTEETAKKGGELGCVGKGLHPKPFDDALFGLEAGKTSGIVETEGGFYIVKLESIAKDAEAEKLGRRQAAREIYLKHEGERLTAEGAKEILAAARGGKSLEDALKAHLDAVVPKPKEDKKADDKKAGAGDKKAAGNKKADDKKVEGTDGEKEKAGVTAENHPFRPVVQTSLPFNAGGDPISDVKPGQDVAKVAFGLEKAGDVPNDIVPLTNGYAVIQLKEKTPVAKEQWEKDREAFLQTLRTNKEHDVLISYIKRLRSKFTEIKIDQQFLTEPKPKPGEGGEEPSPLDEPLGGE